MLQRRQIVPEVVTCLLCTIILFTYWLNDTLTYNIFADMVSTRDDKMCGSFTSRRTLREHRGFGLGILCGPCMCS